MKTRMWIGNVLAAACLAGVSLAPMTALAQGHGHGRDRGHDEEDRGRGGNWNPAPPKKNGRHDNRNWNKHRGGDEWRDDSRWRSDRENPVYRPNYSSQYDHRQQTKNEWRNLATGAGLVGVLGLLTKDSTLTFAGAAGALYSAYRYEQDRKSQNSMNRARAYYFSQPYFTRNGQRFDRRMLIRNGQRYYQFVRR